MKRKESADVCTSTTSFPDSLIFRAIGFGHFDSNIAWFLHFSLELGMLFLENWNL